MDKRALPAALACGIVLLAGCTDGSGTTAAADSTGPSGRLSPASSATSGPGAVAGIPDVISSLEPSVVTIFTGSALGSGVVYRSDGTIVTNEHVVHGVKQVQIAYADGRRGPGTVLASDVGTDLAVVRSDRQDLPAPTFHTQLPQVGDLAIALGSPLGFEGSATAGIISGLGRQIPGSAQTSTALVDLIQTDAPISPGNSGGALVSATGDILGINDAYIPPAQGAVSLGFAIPSATVVDVVDQLLRTGQVRSPFVGIQPGRITPQIAQRLGLQQTEGVLVLDVVEDGPAVRAGLQPGDVLTSLGGKRIASVEDFLGALRGVQPDETVPLVRVRQGDRQTVQLTLGTTTR